MRRSIRTGAYAIAAVFRRLRVASAAEYEYRLGLDLFPPPCGEGRDGVQTGIQPQGRSGDAQPVETFQRRQHQSWPRSALPEQAQQQLTARRRQQGLQCPRQVDVQRTGLA